MFIHAPLAASAAQCAAQHPDRFALWFHLPDYQSYVTLAALLSLPLVVRAPDFCRASRADALLLYVFRMHNEGSWVKLMEHPVFSALPGSNWSATKASSIFREMSRELHRLHGKRASWSECLMGRHALYAAVRDR